MSPQSPRNLGQAHNYLIQRRQGVDSACFQEIFVPPLTFHAPQILKPRFLGNHKVPGYQNIGRDLYKLPRVVR